MPPRQSVRLGLIVGALFLLSACATSRVATAPARPAPAPPPKSTAIAPGYEETGDASWYGHPYHGRKAASGETYDMNQMTAAHRTLPFGTRVRVESLVDGSAVEVRINDRGPFKDDKRIIDLSYAAGKLLGVVGPGVIPVKLRVVSLPGTPSASATSGPAAASATPTAAASSPMPASPPPAAASPAPASPPSAPAVAAISAPATLVSAAPPATVPASAAPPSVPVASAAPLAGQTPISPPAQAPPPIVAETTTSKPETGARAEAAVRAPTSPAPTPVAPSPRPPTPAPGAPAAPGVVSEGWSVQLGAYASEGSAVSLRDTLARSWPDARILRAEVSGRTLWRVRVGNYASRRDADEAAKRLTASGYRAMVVESGRP
jgi:peptidoglycan lytic transglycosylase